MRVALKDCAWESMGDELVLICDPREMMTIEDPDGSIDALLTELSRAPQTPGELSAALRQRGFELSEADVRSGLEGLDAIGLVEDSAHRWLADPVADERHRSNLVFFGSFTGLQRPRAEYVRRLRRAHVLVLGMGGVGSPLVQCLAGLGVGAMTLVDGDHVELGNFARQFLYRHQDIGRSKTERAAEWIRDYDPGIKVRAVDRWITGPDDLADLTGDVDIVAGGLDSEPGASLWANEAAVRAGIPFVTGGAGLTRFSYESMDPARTACFQCDIFDRPEDRAHRPEPDGDVPVAVVDDMLERRGRNNSLIAPVAMQVGSLLALEVLRYLTGFEPPRAAGIRVSLDLRDGLAVQRQTPIEKNPTCRVCSRVPQPLAGHPGQGPR